MNSFQLQDSEECSPDNESCKYNPIPGTLERIQRMLFLYLRFSEKDYEEDSRVRNGYTRSIRKFISTFRIISSEPYELIILKVEKNFQQRCRSDNNSPSSFSLFLSNLENYKLIGEKWNAVSTLDPPPTALIINCGSSVR